MSYHSRKPIGTSVLCMTLAGVYLSSIAPCVAAGDPPSIAPVVASVGPGLPLARLPGVARTEGFSFDLAAGRIALDSRSESRIGVPSPQPVGLVGRYGQALERETRRMNDRDSLQRRVALVDDDESPAPGVQREARRLVSGANGRILTQLVDRILEASSTLQQARDYAEGVRLDVRRGGGVTLGAGKGTEPAPDIAARFTFLVGSNPRVEMRSTLPGNLKTRVELSLVNPGLRAAFSRPISSHLSGSLAGGYEEGGEDRWLSAGVGIKF